MSEHVILVENRNDWRAHFPEATIVSAKDYVGQSEYLKRKNLKVINLCRSYRYLDLGYYCSLLAEARKHKVVPSVRTLTDLSSKAMYSLNVDDEEIDAMVQKSLPKKAADAPVTKTFELFIFFGQCQNKELQELARQFFELFRCPLLKVEFRANGRWHIGSIKPVALNNLTPEQEDFFVVALNTYLSKRWQLPKAKSTSRYDMAILHNPSEQLVPSNVRALKQFVRIGKKLGIEVDLIEKKDYPRLAEYDALFIRETTNINHHTYRFAKKAESEGMVVIDDPNSILKCTNKVYLAELLAVNKVPAPKTVVVQKGNIKGVESEITYPIVLKIPDGSFSRGVFKVDNSREMDETSTRLFKESDLILAQEFVYTEFDWRIGVLNRQPIYACQYFMSKKHWQIVKHSASGQFTQGAFKTLPVAEAPAVVVKAAIDAANLIGDGLYGVDVKQTDRGVCVIEVNDNPNLDAGVEDMVLGDELYRLILDEFIRRLERRRAKLQ